MNFKHLSLEERHYIEISLKDGISMNKIAKNLGRLQSTISREIARNTGQRGYRHKQAHTLASMRHTTKNKAVKVSTLIKNQISGLVKKKWSPEQIAGRLKAEGVISLHHETIYQIILKDKKAGGKLYMHLRHQNKTYRKRYGNGHIEIVKYLVENGADIHAYNDEALQLSTKKGHIGVVKFLVENGANIHVNDDIALRWSAENGHTEIVEYLKEKMK